MVGIIDYGMGNLLSVFHAVEAVGGAATICRRPEEVARVPRLILPGVGAFRDCMANLRRAGFVEVLQQTVIQERKPILGICLGMQVMARRGFEGGECPGLGWLDAEVVRLQPADAALRIPQIGWNQVEWRSECALFGGLAAPADFYFVHSYSMRCAWDGDVLATCDYGGPVTAAVGRDNIFATQFHPEKSQEHGLRLLQNFLGWTPGPC